MSASFPIDFDSFHQLQQIPLICEMDSPTTLHKLLGQSGQPWGSPSLESRGSSCKRRKQKKNGEITMMLTMSKHINDIFTKRCGCHEIWPISQNNSWKHTISSFCIFPAELDMIFLGWLCTLTNTHWTSLNHLGFPHERAWYATCPRDRSRLDLRWHPWLRTAHWCNKANP